MKDVFWGTPDATVSFCENKYVKYDWIAEYHNTISSLCYVMVGLGIIKMTRFKFLGQLMCCVGVGAMLLHGTLRHWAQMGDEMSMLSLSFFTLKELRPRTSRYIIYPLLICYYIYIYTNIIYNIIYNSIYNIYKHL